MIHTKTGGKRTIFLPQPAQLVKTMFNNEIVGKNINRIDYDFAPNSTILFFIEY